MQTGHSFEDSDSDTSLQEYQPQPMPISVLKHLPAPLQLLDALPRTYEIYSPRCLYAEPLNRTPQYTMPKAEHPHKVLPQRLHSIEDACF